MAHLIASVLEGQGIACHIDRGTTLLGEAQPCGVMVEAHLLHRAQELLADAPFTDAELDFLATGRLSCDDSKE
jgi:hypothetical protein